MPAPQLTGFEHRVIVGIADLAVANSPSVILTTYSLGSCLGVAMYDPIVRVGGLLHAMLPNSAIDTVKGARQPGMFLDTGIAMMLSALKDLKAEKRRLKTYVVGGAQIMDSSGFFNIGKRNYQALLEIFGREGLRIDAEQVGGLVNRTMHLNIASGGVSLKVSGQAKDMPLCKS